MSTGLYNVTVRGELLDNEPLAKQTSWRVGGPADRLFRPADRADLEQFLRQLPVSEPLTWIGLGSNLLVRDGGIRGTVINTTGRLNRLQLKGCEQVYVEAGVPCAHVARFCADNGLVGAEFLAGIPGTMGGALKMNAGAFGDETWPLVEEATLIDRHGESRVVPGGQFKFGYRTVVLADDQWFLACLLRLKSGDVESSQARIRGLLAKRGSSQPIGQPSCGSVFRNPPGNFAARLIEQCGLKGYTIGKASVSEKHANFIINNGGACADDIEQLINYLKQEVKRKEAIDLITEVCILGETSEEQSAGAQQ